MQTGIKTIKDLEKLPEPLKEDIIENIIETSDKEPDEQLQKAWADEAKRRLDSYYRYGSKTLTEEEVLNRIEKA